MRGDMFKVSWVSIVIQAGSSTHVLSYSILKFMIGDLSRRELWNDILTNIQTSYFKRCSRV